jgi:uncharacterized protein with NRDE domain
VEAGKRQLEALLAQTDAQGELLDTDSLVDGLFAIISAPEKYPDHMLPATGCPVGWERELSSAFVAHPEFPYGTRTQV